MTLQEFLNLCSESPGLILLYFLCLPLTAFLAWMLGRGEGHLSPWKYLYSVLVYLACIPGIFAALLNIYVLFFEKKSLMDMDVYTQILPIIIMVFTLMIVRKNVDFDQIPGFDKLSGLFLAITAVLAMMWILDKTHIVAFTYMPFYWVIILLIGIFILLRFGLKRFFA